MAKTTKTTNNSKNNKSNESKELPISNKNHPARKFIAEAESHVGPKGHAWVQSMVPIGNQAWCAATCCAVAKACGFADKIMPSGIFTADGFGQAVVETYGGTFIAGPMRGDKDGMPQIGDLICYDYGSNPNKYKAYHIGMVRGVEGDTVLTVEGNTGDSEYLFRERDRHGSNIAYYARPNWKKVGGSSTTGTTTGTGYDANEPLYDSESTRADASLREVCYLDADAKPSIKVTAIKLNVINYTGLLSKFVEVFGGGSSSSSSNDNIDKLPAVPREIVSFLVGKGLNTAAGVGVIANIKEESNFKTDAVGDGGTSFGICQWHNDRGTAMKQMAGKNWSSNLTGQLNYLWHELTSSYSETVLAPLQKVPNSLAGAESAAETFCRKFEVPDKVDDQVKIRRKNAKEFWGQVVVASKTNSPSGSTSAAQGKIVTQSGKTISKGTAIEIPSSVPQTGIIANYTSYTDFYGSWASGTAQQKLSKIWGDQGKPHTYSIATISGYYLLALTPKFGACGDIVSIVFTDGKSFNAIIGDVKGTDAGSEWGHYLGSQVDIVEWEAYGSSQDDLRKGLDKAGWLGKKIKKIINYGTWLDGSKT